MSMIRTLAVALALGLLLSAPVLADGMQMAETVTLGPLKLSGGFSRATLPNAPVAGGFLTIKNTGTEDDTLIGAASPVAGHMEVHEMKMEGDVMKMHEIEGGLPIPAGETVVLRPGGFHVMFMQLKEPLVEGSTVMVTLTFARAGSVEVPLLVGAPNAKAMPGMHDMKGMKNEGALRLPLAAPAPGAAPSSRG